MTTFYLIRHAANDWLGNAIAGWTAGVSLNTEGRAQAERLAARLASRKIAHIYSSPLERARETAAPLAAALGIEVGIREALGEVRFGDWSGTRLQVLERDPRWRLFNHYRSGTRPPGGELAVETQARVVAELESLRERHPGETVAVVSHADSIRAALAYYLGVPIDLYQRMECLPASFSVLRLSEEGPMVAGLNQIVE
ncbi:MAG: histidine phosphatase family protein [Acidobacteriia bacterium]|nr:histidine phosphatase family protein [Terriglobia bacterium]